MKIRNDMSSGHEPNESKLSPDLHNNPAVADGRLERGTKRVGYSNDVTFSVQGESYRGTSKDISAGGMSIETNGSFPVGTSLIITIDAVAGKRAYTFHAEIVRAEEGTIAVRFLDRPRSPRIHTPGSSDQPTPRSTQEKSLYSLMFPKGL